MTHAPKSRGKLPTVLAILQTVLLVLSAAAFSFAIIFAVSYFSVAEAPEGSEIGEQISVGLSRGLSAVFFVIATVFTAVFSIPGEIVAILMILKTRERRRIYGICATVLHALLPLSCAVLWIVML